MRRDSTSVLWLEITSSFPSTLRQITKVQIHISIQKHFSSLSKMAARSRLPLALGLTAFGGLGYYIYSAGGSPKVAEKKFEREGFEKLSSLQNTDYLS